MRNDKFLSMLGLATRAGKTVTGAFLTEKAVKSQKAKLVILAEDASDNTKKDILDMCSFYKVTVIQKYSRAELGNSCGKDDRVVITVLDRGFADSLMKINGIDD